MTYWDGTRWTPEPAPRTPTRSRLFRRLFGAGAEAAIITLLMFGLIAGTTLAAQGGRGGGNQLNAPSTCVVDGNVVTGAGLPTDQVINFMVTENGYTWGWALGFAGDEAWGIAVPDRTGPTTYEFASRTWGKGGAHYTVFSRCSAS